MRIIIAAVAALSLCSQALADTQVASDAIATRIAETIAAKLPTTGHYRVALADPGFQLTLPAAAQGRYDIAALSLDPARQGFSAALGFTNASGEREYVRIAGSATAVINVPALTRDIGVGETIAEADLMTLEVSADRAGASLLTSSAAVAGQAARRPLRARTPLFSYDIRRPVAVKKGELVTLVYALPGIELTVQGQAQAEAATGDTVAILNTRSRRTVEARISGPGMAVVSTPSTLAAAQ